MKISRGSVVIFAVCFSFFTLIFSSGCVSELQEILTPDRGAGSGEMYEGDEESETVALKKRQTLKDKEGDIEERTIKSDLPARDYFFHRIKWKGENLSIIAKWYLGDFEKWTLLSKINPSLDPNRMQVGDKVRIPVSKIKTTVAMPKDFVDEFVRRNRNGAGIKKAETEKRANKPEDSETKNPEVEPDLFGPKELQEE